MIGISLAEKAWVPDAVIRLGIKLMLRERLGQFKDGGCEADQEAVNTWLEQMADSPIAWVPDLANEQHYEVPAGFFELVMGPFMKYSCGYFSHPEIGLDQAEFDMLALTSERAEVSPGMRILDLGCGWGSLSLFLADRYPDCEITGVSNSNSQREFIAARAKERGLDNLEIITADMNEFDSSNQFDRVMSVEMFEHMRNWKKLLGRIDGWLAPTGKLFLHYFCHAKNPYPYETEGAGNWMGRHFFSGGMMPSEDLILYLQEDLRVERKWRVSGVHYHRTCEQWLKRVDARSPEALEIMASTYGDADAKLWLQRWRLFFLACSELFRYRSGNEWFISHVLLGRGSDSLK
ncbi:MAG: SAM-dependent methyltransferase [Deltaproteobacteria bacterium]|nr:SAM-dependent methyltransferase [Deltaproteobacteria bacterium]